jgi:hypothetical protein
MSYSACQIGPSVSYWFRWKEALPLLLCRRGAVQMIQHTYRQLMKGHQGVHLR